MKILGIIDEDFVNYKKPCMTVEFPYCDFKCGQQVCQNSLLADADKIEINEKDIIKRYLQNDISQALCCQGLEPFDSWWDLIKLLKEFRKETDDDIVIYTGYTEEECLQKTATLIGLFDNVIVKFGRYIPNQEPHYDDELGVNLSSNNQYAKRL